MGRCNLDADIYSTSLPQDDWCSGRGQCCNGLSDAGGGFGRDLAVIPQGAAKALSVEHLTGEMTVVVHVEGGSIVRAEVLRTARKLMDGVVFPTDKAVKGTEAVE